MEKLIICLRTTRKWQPSIHIQIHPTSQLVLMTDNQATQPSQVHPRVLSTLSQWLTSLREFVSLIHTEINCRNHGQVFKWKHWLKPSNREKRQPLKFAIALAHLVLLMCVKWSLSVFPKMGTYSLKVLSSWAVCSGFLIHRRQREFQLRIAISIYLPRCWVTQNSGTCKINTSFCSKPWWTFFLMHLDSSGKKITM